MYLMHWKLLQHYRNQYPDLNLELDVKLNLTLHQIQVLYINGAYHKLDWILYFKQLELKQKILQLPFLIRRPNFGSTASQSSAFLGGGYDFWDDDSIQPIQLLLQIHMEHMLDLPLQHSMMEIILMVTV